MQPTTSNSLSTGQTTAPGLSSWVIETVQPVDPCSSSADRITALAVFPWVAQTVQPVEPHSLSVRPAATTPDQSQKVASDVASDPSPRSRSIPDTPHDKRWVATKIQNDDVMQHIFQHLSVPELWKIAPVSSAFCRGAGEMYQLRLVEAWNPKGQPVKEWVVANLEFRSRVRRQWHQVDPWENKSCLQRVRIREGYMWNRASPQLQKARRETIKKAALLGGSVGALGGGITGFIMGAIFGAPGGPVGAVGVGGVGCNCGAKTGFWLGAGIGAASGAIIWSVKKGGIEWHQKLDRDSREFADYIAPRAKAELLRLVQESLARDPVAQIYACPYTGRVSDNVWEAIDGHVYSWRGLQLRKLPGTNQTVLVSGTVVTLGNSNHMVRAWRMQLAICSRKIYVLTKIRNEHGHTFSLTFKQAMEAALNDLGAKQRQFHSQASAQIRPVRRRFPSLQQTPEPVLRIIEQLGNSSEWGNRIVRLEPIVPVFVQYGPG